MNLKALRRPHDLGRATSQLDRATRVSRDDRGRTFPQATRLVGRWTVASDGRLALAWELEPEWELERPAPPLIPRKRGSDA